MRKHSKNGKTLVEVRPGEGGHDAALFAEELVGVIVALLRRKDVGAEVAGGEGRTVTVSVTGSPPAMLGRLSGTHRVQRIPASDKKGRRHTSTATVAVIGGMVAREPSRLTEDDLEITWFSGSGAGGQHRNRSRNCCRIRHRPSGIEAVGTSSRSRRANEAEARSVLEARLRDVARERADERVNRVRAGQVDSERSGKGWTWNDQRDEVVEHASGDRWRMRDALRGKF